MAAPQELGVELVVDAANSTAVASQINITNEAGAPANPAPATGLPEGISLTDLDAELLCNILRHLLAHGMATARATCKLMALILGDLDRPFLAAARADGIDELKRSLAPKLVSPPSVGVLFANGSKNEKGLRRLVRALPPRMHLVGGNAYTVVGVDPPPVPPPAPPPPAQGSKDKQVGCVSPAQAAGVYCSSNRHSGSRIALTLGHFPEAGIGSFVVNDASRPIAAQLEEDGALEEGWKVFVVMVVGSYGRHSAGAVLGQLQGKHPEAAIIGGMATGSWLCRAHAGSTQFVHSGVVGLMFRGNVPLTALVCKNAAGGRLRAACEMLEAERRTLLGGLMFTCTARNERQDASDYAATFPQTPLAGMPAGGEIGPQAGFRATAGAAGGAATADGADAGNVSMHGFTAVYGLFHVPTRQLGPLSLHAVETDVAAAYAEHRASPAAVAVARAAKAAEAVEAARAAEGDEEGDESDEGDDDEEDDEGEGNDDDDDFDDEWDEEDDDEWDEDDDDEYDGPEEDPEDAAAEGDEDNDAASADETEAAAG